MSTRFDICTPRKDRDGKTRWTRIGTAWQSDKGIQLVFDALPIPDGEGRVVANLFEPREREPSARADRQDAGNRARQARDDVDSEIPF